MRADEIIVEFARLKEAPPSSFLDRFGNYIQSLTPGIGSRLSNIKTSGQAALDVGEKANELEKDFRLWAERSGLDLNNITKTQLDHYWSQRDLPKVNITKPSYNFNDSNVNKNFWTRVSQASFMGNAPTTQSGTQPATQLATQSGSQIGQYSVNNIVSNIDPNDIKPLLNALVKKYPNILVP